MGAPQTTQGWSSIPHSPGLQEVISLKVSHFISNSIKSFCFFPFSQKLDTNCHQDFHYFPYLNHSMLAVFIHLDDTDPGSPPSAQITLCGWTMKFQGWCFGAIHLRGWADDVSLLDRAILSITAPQKVHPPIFCKIQYWWPALQSIYTTFVN